MPDLFIQIISHRLAIFFSQNISQQPSVSSIFLFKKSENNGVRAVSSVRTPVVRVRFASEGQKREAGSTQTGAGFQERSPGTQVKITKGCMLGNVSQTCYRPTRRGCVWSVRCAQRAPHFFKKKISHQPPVRAYWVETGPPVHN
jgi:hypothetical protein